MRGGKRQEGEGRDFDPQSKNSFRAPVRWRRLSRW